MQVSASQLAAIVPVFIVVLDALRRFVGTKRERKGLPLPPGPPGLPLIGNAHSVNLDQPWKTYTEWHAKYGDIIHLQILDQHVIVLGSHSVAVELLEKRSQVYSDRPYIGTLTPYGGDINFIFARYGDQWRFCRRTFHQTFRFEAALNFRPMQLRRARQMVMSIADSPESYFAHFSTFAVSVAMLATYGYEPKLIDDPLVHVIEEYAEVTARSFTPEKSVLIKLFPFLLHVPDWFPGSWLKREAAYAYSLSRKAIEMPYQYAEERRKTAGEYGTYCMISDHLSRLRELDESKRSEYLFGLKTTAVTSILAAEETTSSVLIIVTLCLVKEPRIWKRAQAEVDKVIGKNRLPDFGDRSALPYVEAIIREALRWNPILPCILHATSESDVYNGFYIPKDAVVIANVWAMSRDESRYPNASAFVPERFLNKDGTLNDDNPTYLAFGFGRRICPGRYTADASVWCAVVTLLATVDFYLAKDAEGKDLAFEPKWLNGLTHRPEVFPCRLSLRPHVNKALLERALAD